MASIANSVRLSARAAAWHAQRESSRRGFQSSARSLAAQNYPMPALSPTMTEGNVMSWRVKEGDSFSAGDVLLEIETDKATMDVEAQDDGILMKITSPDGSKGVKVGQRIAVTAEPGDDISSLEIPKESAGAEPSKPAETEKPSPKKEAPSERQEGKTASSPEPSKDTSSGQRSGMAKEQIYPLSPSVEHLLHQNGLSSKDAANIQASGPNGRLLKGDVLAYLGQINKDYPAQSSARLSKLSHLDLSNIQLAPTPEPKKAAKPPTPELPQETEIALPISLTSVIATQKRVQDSLGIHLPLSVFIARASELANEGLPLGKNRKLTSDELFNSVLGLDKVAPSSKGTYFPQITGLGPSLPPKPAKKPDIIDILAAKPQQATRVLSVAMGISTGQNIFSVTATKGEEKRAAEYLERIKLVLEKEPGRLVV